MSTVSTAVSGPSMFERWSAAQMELHASQPPRRGRARAKAGLSPTSIKIYQSIWRGWLDWLTTERLAWNAVTSADVERFLAHRTPSNEGRPAIDRTTMAQYTRQRYFRVLQGVYSDASMLGVIEYNPVSPIHQEGHQPRVREIDRRPQLLPPGVLALLRSPAWLAEAIPLGAEQEWWLLRDRACVALVAHCGVTTGELRTLQGRDLRDGLTAYQAERTSGYLRSDSTGPLFLDIRDGSDRVVRSVPLPLSALRVLDPWLAARRVQLRLQRQRWNIMEEGARENTKLGKPRNSERAPLLLASGRNAAKTAGAGELTAGMLFRVFRTCLQVAYAQAPTGIGKEQYVATGAAIVRNSVIAEWVEHQPEMAAELAGLKSVASWLPHARQAFG